MWPKCDPTGARKMEKSRVLGGRVWERKRWHFTPGHQVRAGFNSQVREEGLPDRGKSVSQSKEAGC